MRPITLRWAGGEHAFALPLGALRALQKKTNAGPEEIWGRLRAGTWKIDDVGHVLTEGLIGAGSLEAQEATRLVVDMLEKHPSIPMKLVAIAILNHSIMGEADDRVGEPEGEAPPPESGASPSSTEPAP